MVRWSDHRGLIRLAIWLAAYSVACGLFIMVRGRSLFAAIVVIFAIVGAARSVHEAARSFARSSERPAAPAGGTTAHDRLARFGGIAVAVTGLVLIVVGRTVVKDGWAFFGLALLYLGLGLVAERLRDDERLKERWGWRLLALATACVFLGLLGAAFVPHLLASSPFVAGLLVAPIGLALVSSDLLGRLDTARRNPADTLGASHLLSGSVACGAVLLVGGLAFLLLLGTDPLYVVLGGATLFVLALAIAARSNADVVIVVAMAAVVWTLTQHEVGTPTSLVPEEGDHVIVALGDSYISGEGADEFYVGTNVQGREEADHNDCRRAPTAYPALLTLEKDLPHKLLFLACSGDRIEGVRAQLAEYRAQRDEKELKTDLVLLSVGGNDALFGTIGRTCLLPGNCAELASAWTANLEQVERSLHDLYLEVRDSVGGARVLVVPYPVPIKAGGRCERSAFSSRERTFLQDFTVALNDAITRAATADDVGFDVVDTMPKALDGHRHCEAPGPPGVNFLEAGSVFGTLEQSVNPTNWFHNSLHPNELGHELMRAAVVDRIGRPSGPTAGGGAPAGPTEGQLDDDVRQAERLIEEDACEGRSEGDLTSCTGRWQRRELARVAVWPGSLVLLTMIGAWLLAVVAIHTWREQVAEPRGPGALPGERPASVRADGA